MLPAWDEVRRALVAAICAALPLQLRQVPREPISGVGLHVDAYYGSVGLYLLPESAVIGLGPERAMNLGDWPISTDWTCGQDHAIAFASHWDPWDSLFHDHLDELTQAETDEKFKALLRVACEALLEVEALGLFETFPHGPAFRVVVSEHGEPDQVGQLRFEAFRRTGEVLLFGAAA